MYFFFSVRQSFNQRYANWCQSLDAFLKKGILIGLQSLGTSDRESLSMLGEGHEFVQTVVRSQPWIHYRLAPCAAALGSQFTRFLVRTNGELLKGRPASAPGGRWARLCRPRRRQPAPSSWRSPDLLLWRCGRSYRTRPEGERKKKKKNSVKYSVCMEGIIKKGSPTLQ